MLEPRGRRFVGVAYLAGTDSFSLQYGVPLPGGHSLRPVTVNSPISCGRRSFLRTQRTRATAHGTRATTQYYARRSGCPIEQGQGAHATVNKESQSFVHRACGKPLTFDSTELNPFQAPEPEHTSGLRVRARSAVPAQRAVGIPAAASHRPVRLGPPFRRQNGGRVRPRRSRPFAGSSRSGCARSRVASLGGTAAGDTAAGSRRRGLAVAGGALEQGVPGEWRFSWSTARLAGPGGGQRWRVDLSDGRAP